MRIMHTADWHLGRIFHHHPLLSQQKEILEQIYKYILAEQPDIFILSGDIFDRTHPPKEAIEIFGQFLQSLYEQTDIYLVLIAGNHDSGQLIGFSGVLQDPARVLVAGTLEQTMGKPLIFEQKGKKYAISALPYCDPPTARQYFKDTKLVSFQDVLRAQVTEAKKHIPEESRWIIAAHCFVSGGKTSDSERSLTIVGGLETVSEDVFEAADYVALGHLHRQQIAGKCKHIRYSGSIMPYHFDETDQQKSVLLIDFPSNLESDAPLAVRSLPLTSSRKIRTITTDFYQLLDNSEVSEAEPCLDYVYVRLTNTRRVADAIARLRAFYPNIAGLEYVTPAEDTSVSIVQGRREAMRNPLDLCNRFYEDVSGQKLDHAQHILLADLLEDFEQNEKLDKENN